MKRSTSWPSNTTGAATKSFPCRTGSDGCTSQRLSGMPRNLGVSLNASVKKLYGGEIFGVDVGGRPRWLANGTGFESQRLQRPLLVPEPLILGAQREIRGAPLRPRGVWVKSKDTGGEAPRRATLTGLNNRGPGAGTGSNPVASPRSGRASRSLSETRRLSAFPPASSLVLSSHAHR